MLFTVTFCLVFGVYTVRSEELAVDPLSVYTDPNLYRFCWRQLGDFDDEFIKGYNLIDKGKIENFPIIPDDRNHDKIFCIEKKHRTARFKIRLQMTRETDQPKFINFTTQFCLPLTSSVDLIKFSMVRNGVFFEMNSEFAAIDSSVLPLCHILLIINENRRQSFVQLKMGSQKHGLFQKISANSTFSFYYTCDMTNTFLTSTKVGVQTGSKGADDIVDELEPIMQIPTRRFLKVVWKHARNLRRRYDVAIYLKGGKRADICIKIFRIYVYIFPDTKRMHKTLASNCNKNVLVEDLGNFNEGGDGWISVVLDMVIPLKMYNNYKMSIFWINDYNTISQNYLHFTPLSNEHSGNANSKFFSHKSLSYTDIINEASSMYQSVLSPIEENPFKHATLNNPGLENVDIISSVMTEDGYKNTPNSVITNDVSTLYEKCKLAMCSKNFFPYFYAFFYSDKSTGRYFDIIQLPIPQDQTGTIDQLKFVSNDKELLFLVSWKIANYPFVTAPAMLGVEIKNLDNDCHAVYLLKCRTCNKIYMNDTLKSAERQINDWTNKCSTVKKLVDYYDAGDSSISFKTDKMTPFILFKVQIFSFKFAAVQISEMSRSMYITETAWQKFGGRIIGVICTLCVIGLIVGLFFVCRRLTETPATKENEMNKVEPNDEIYDEET